MIDKNKIKLYNDYNKIIEEGVDYITSFSKDIEKDSKLNSLGYIRTTDIKCQTHFAVIKLLQLQNELKNIEKLFV